ncbi:MAG: hypothetical protein ACLQU2_27000 [Candidatus Binataceae bacterium]
MAELVELGVDRRWRRRIIGKNGLAGFLEQMQRRDNLLQRNASFGQFRAKSQNITRISVHILTQKGTLVSKQRGLENASKFGLGKAAIIPEVQNVKLIPVGGDLGAPIADNFKHLPQVVEVFVPQQMEIARLAAIGMTNRNV